MSNNNHTMILRKPDTTARTNLSKSTLYNRVKSGLFPPPISLGSRAVGFISSEVDAVIQSWCEEQSPEQIKTLVQTLVASRANNKRGI